MGDFSSIEKQSHSDLKNEKNKDIKKSLNNYINQLKFHFDLNDKDILELLESVLKSRKNFEAQNKWWQIWR